MSKISTWPKIVRLLTADEMCIWPLSTDPDCGCLVYWTRKVFLNRLPFETKAQVETRMGVLGLVQRGLEEELGTYITFSGDEKRYTRERLANSWNRMIRGLGYVLECDLE